jgi:4-carboxymuconolactone decarboxylase
MAGPRIAMLSRDEARAAAADLGMVPEMADLNIFRVLLVHPSLARRVNDLLLMLIFEGALDARLRELIIMRLGWSTGCDYEWTQHWRVATRMGIPEADLLACRDWRNAERFGETERAVLQATDEIVDQGFIGPETWARCERAIGEPRALLEMVAVIGNWRMISSILRSLEIPVEEGTASWPPDGASPA